ncbi:heavy metal translocating P-type ATPase [bacterium]|nr:heavy metal translocating P-type ATPase [bacterium]
MAAPVIEKRRLRVTGMSCQHCVSAVRGALETVPGVHRVDVSLAEGVADIEVDESVTLEALRRSLEGEDYALEESTPTVTSPTAAVPAETAPTGEFVVLEIEGMSCASCVRKVEKALGGVPGVETARVNFATERARLNLAPGGDRAEVTRRAAEAVDRAGYKARAAGAPGGHDRAADVAVWKRRWIAGAVLSLPVVALEMGAHAGLHAVHFSGADVIAFAFATVVVAVLGAPFLSNAVKALRHGQFTMDTLVALGVGAAYGFSAVVRVAGWLGHELAGGHVYFESAAVILTLVALGKWLEAGARLRAGQAIRALMEMSAREATVERDGREIPVPVEDIVPGDVMIVRPGEKIPTDGEVVGGSSEVDESMMTGESMPVLRQPGDPLFGSSINGSGLLRVRATRVGGETALARIVEMVERAQEGKAAIQKVADQVANVFVPVVMVIALVTFLAWGLLAGAWVAGLINAVTVLIIACPCALGLATPTALMVGTGRGAREGILIRDVAAVERAREIDVVVLDKTGTVTEGKPAVVDVVPLGGLDRDRLLALAASAEHGSEHPLARAVVAAAGGTTMPLSDFRNIPGRGVTATVDGVALFVGSPQGVAELGLKLAQEATAALARLEEAALTVVVIADTGSGTALGLIGIADKPKESSAAAIRALHAESKVAVWLLTGDNARTAAAVAESVGIPPGRVIANVKPEDKARRIAELQRAGHRVAMVGDGVNDAPALAQADLGMALGTGTDVAMETGAITLVSGNLDGVVRAISLSRATMGKIRQNLFWAFAYNAILIPVAALGMLSPMFAGAAMALSSVTVVGNSLLLGQGKTRSPRGHGDTEKS